MIDTATIECILLCVSCLIFLVTVFAWVKLNKLYEKQIRLMETLVHLSIDVVEKLEAIIKNGTN